MFSLLVALISSILLILSSPGLDLEFFAWIAIVPLLFTASTNKPKRAFQLGFIAGLAYYTYLLHWVTISLGTYGHLPWWLTYPALLLLAAYMGLYPALFCGLMSRTKNINPVWTAPFIWVGLDYIRGLLFTGFPWQDLGYTQFNIPLFIQVADLTGHHGITFFLILVNSFLFILFTRRQFMPLAYTLIVMVAAASYSVYRLKTVDEQSALSPTITVSIVQPNIEQDQKWMPKNRQTTIDAHISLSDGAVSTGKPDLVIWPETAIPILGSNSVEFAEIQDQTVNKHNYSLLSGIPYSTFTEGRRNIYNSAILFHPNGSRQVYHKQHLVPFGEYIPLSNIIPFLAPLVESVGDFSSGTLSQPLISPKASLGVLICFESIFPELARTQTANGADLLVNITNDAWFGRSNASIQHLAMVVFRAVENRRSLARSANTGISCFITPTGRILQPTRLFESCFITESLPIPNQKTIFNQLGALFPQLCVILSFIITIGSFLGKNKK